MQWITDETSWSLAGNQRRWIFPLPDSSCLLYVSSYWPTEWNLTGDVLNPCKTLGVYSTALNANVRTKGDGLTTDTCSSSSEVQTLLSNTMWCTAYSTRALSVWKQTEKKRHVKVCGSQRSFPRCRFSHLLDLKAPDIDFMGYSAPPSPALIGPFIYWLGPKKKVPKVSEALAVFYYDPWCIWVHITAALMRRMHFKCLLLQ